MSDFHRLLKLGRVLILLSVLAGCASPWRDSERVVALHDDTRRYVPDLGQVTIALPVPAVDSFVVGKVEARFTIYSWNWSDLDARLEMAGRQVTLWSNEGDDETNPFVDWRYTYLFDGNPGGDTLYVTVQDCLADDDSWWYQTEVAVHYRRVR